jgi:hypothetical protein
MPVQELHSLGTLNFCTLPETSPSNMSPSPASTTIQDNTLYFSATLPLNGGGNISNPCLLHKRSAMIFSCVDVSTCSFNEVILRKAYHSESAEMV